MRIFDIEIYRDGGSLEFRIERDGKNYQLTVKVYELGKQVKNGGPRELIKKGSKFEAVCSLYDEAGTLCVNVRQVVRSG